MEKGWDSALAVQHEPPPPSLPLTTPSSTPVGVEAFNGIVSSRHNRFNNHGGSVKAKDGERRKLDKFEVLGTWMGRYCAWQAGLADQLFVGDHAVMDCGKVAWDDATGTYVEKKKAGDNDDAEDDWFDMEESLDIATKTEMVEELVVKMECDDEGWNSEDEIQGYSEGDDEIVKQGQALLLLSPDGDLPRTPRTCYQNRNHTHS